MRQYLVVLAAVVSIVLPYHPLLADERTETARDGRELDRVVVTATMTEHAIEDSPGSVEVITAREMEERNVSTVAEALETATGLIVKGESGRVMAPSIRGTKSKHTLVLLDGRRMASGFGDLVDLSQIPVVMVDRIEVVRGPASGLYGSDALGGVVNIITKKATREWKARLKGQYGTDKYGEGTEYIGSGYGGGFIDRFSFLVSGQLGKKAGWDRVLDENDDGDKEREGYSAGRFTLDIVKNHVLSGGFEYGKKNMEGLRYMENLDRNRDADSRRSGYFLQYDAKFKETYALMLRLNRSETKTDIDITPVTSNPETSGMKYFLNQGEAKFSGLFFDSHLVTMGTELRKEGRDDRSSDMTMNNFSLFLQDEYQIVKPLALIVGLRFDENSKYGSELTPKASLIYDIARYLRVKGSYGRGFRAPTISELSVTSWKQKGKLVYEPNGNLKPEKSDSYEIRMEGEYERFRGSLTFFRNEVKDMIDAIYYKTEGKGKNAKDYYKYQNISNARMQGVELESGLTIPFGFSLTGNITWLDTKNKDTGEELEGQPDYKGDIKLGYDYPDWKLHANMRLSYFGRSYYATGDKGGYPLYHGYVSRNICKNVKLFAGVNNIFDNAGEEPTFYYTGFSLDF